MNTQAGLSLIIAICALLISVLTFVLNAYYRTFRAPRVKIAFGDSLGFWIDFEGYIQFFLDVVLINYGAQHGSVVRLVGSLLHPSAPEAGFHWRAFIESRNIGKEGEEFHAIFDFAGWAKTLVVPGLSATSHSINFVSDRPMQLVPGTYSLKLIALGGRHGYQLAESTVRVCMTDTDRSYAVGRH